MPEDKAASQQLGPRGKRHSGNRSIEVGSKRKERLWRGEQEQKGKTSGSLKGGGGGTLQTTHLHPGKKGDD